MIDDDDEMIDEALNARLARLLFYLRPYSIDEVEQMIIEGTIPQGMYEAFAEAKSISWLLSEED